MSDEHVIEIQIDPVDIQIIDAGVSDRGQDAPEVGIGCEERRLDQW